MTDPTPPPRPPGIPNPVPATRDPSHEPELAAAAARVDAELDALAADACLPVVFDVQEVFVLVLGATRSIQGHLTGLEGLPGVDVGRIRRLHDYTLALFVWNASAGCATDASPRRPRLHLHTRCPTDSCSP